MFRRCKFLCLNRKFALPALLIYFPLFFPFPGRLAAMGATDSRALRGRANLSAAISVRGGTLGDGPQQEDNRRHMFA